MSKTTNISVADLFRRHRRDLLALLGGKAGCDDASDLLQETFVRLLRVEEKHLIIDASSFTRTIALNLARDRSRRKSAEARWLIRGEPVADTRCEEATPEERLTQRERTRLLAEAVANLPPRCRDVFKLCFEESLSAPEAAKRLGISDSMTRRYLRDAIRRCRAALD
ncbi:MAG TPA: RNA polymerase sigma factor [Methylocystis sp.]|nr:RNA polymerase sigma factor [Methylocystis sp.]